MGIGMFSRQYEFFEESDGEIHEEECGNQTQKYHNNSSLKENLVDQKVF